MSNKYKKAENLKKYSSLTLTVLTVITAIAFIIQALRIYMTGISPANQPSKGVYVEQIYSTGIISARFSEIAFIVCLWFICLIACIVIRCIYGFDKEKPVTDGIKEWREKEIARASIGKRKQTPKWVAPALLVVALGLMVFGVINGGMTDVLKKAIMICTECVGLG